MPRPRGLQAYTGLILLLFAALSATVAGSLLRDVRAGPTLSLRGTPLTSATLRTGKRPAQELDGEDPVLVLMRLRGGAVRDIPPLNSTENELEKGTEERETEDPNPHEQHEEHVAPSHPLPSHTGEAGGGDQGYVQLPEDLRMPPGMQHMYQWEAPDGNQVSPLGPST